jgi:hypothetical protein
MEVGNRRWIKVNEKRIYNKMMVTDEGKGVTKE